MDKGDGDTREVPLDNKVRRDYVASEKRRTGDVHRENFVICET